MVRDWAVQAPARFRMDRPPAMVPAGHSAVKHRRHRGLPVVAMHQAPSSTGRYPVGGSGSSFARGNGSGSGLSPGGGTGSSLSPGGGRVELRPARHGVESRRRRDRVESVTGRRDRVEYVIGRRDRVELCAPGRLVRGLDSRRLMARGRVSGTGGGTGSSSASGSPSGGALSESGEPPSSSGSGAEPTANGGTNVLPDLEPAGDGGSSPPLSPSALSQPSGARRRWFWGRGGVPKLRGWSSRRSESRRPRARKSTSSSPGGGGQSQGPATGTGGQALPSTGGSLSSAPRRLRRAAGPRSRGGRRR